VVIKRLPYAPHKLNEEPPGKLYLMNMGSALIEHGQRRAAEIETQ
jgi:hypothetical protein